MLLTNEQREQYLAEIKKEHPTFDGRFDMLYEVCGKEPPNYFVSLDRSKYEAIPKDAYYNPKLDWGFHNLTKNRNCCGIIDVGGWAYSGRGSLPANIQRNFKLFVDYCQRAGYGKGYGLVGGIIVAHTNDNYRNVNALLKECGFAKQTFFNASSGNHMHMWTLVLHPEE